ncbi:hypothetical protein N309_00830, partial [Tinamus guttatus]
GSLGIDLATAVNVCLRDTSPMRVPSQFKGLPWSEDKSGGLLLGRSSTGMSGVFVVPGIIDSDSEGVIEMVVYTLTPLVTIVKGSRLAQIVPLQNLLGTINPQVSSLPLRKQNGFGSTGGQALLTLNMKHRPLVRVQVSFRGQKVYCQGLMDTSADCTIVS